MRVSSVFKLQNRMNELLITPGLGLRISLIPFPTKDMSNQKVAREIVRLPAG